ncbi:hypothetical protein [Sinorhizobium sp. BG8]|uniref:hypothetical protein n=1 Tax=Sinorhizobium sp. BG8 TaxID=2613773 RepID=UPI00193D614B|nr:hypothetical protein [Sinorhizobium sp. BG8]QRM54988.1 hypothetical protein F3Y30_10855 [Sinorhizobium sp. BG8]
MELTSREYKLTLDPAAFAGDPQSLVAANDGFWTTVRALLVQNGITVKGDADSAEAGKKRQLYFLDTLQSQGSAKGALLRDAGLVYRLRRRVDSDGDWTATLKFRHGDRLLADSEDFAAVDPEGEVKFEEDIKAARGVEGPGFWALFSRSASVKVNGAEEFRTVGDCLAPFKDLREATLPPSNGPVAVVNGLRVTEHVYEGWKLDFEDAESECALILWWDTNPVVPIAAEFSFRFDLVDGKIKADIARDAWKVIGILYDTRWVAREGSTKTQLVYG